MRNCGYSPWHSRHDWDTSISSKEAASLSWEDPDSRGANVNYNNRMIGLVGRLSFAELPRLSLWLFGVAWLVLRLRVLKEHQEEIARRLIDCIYSMLCIHCFDPLSVVDLGPQESRVDLLMFQVRECRCSCGLENSLSSSSLYLAQIAV